MHHLKWILLLLVLTGPVMNGLNLNVYLGYSISIVSLFVFLILEIKAHKHK